MTQCEATFWAFDPPSRGDHPYTPYIGEYPPPRWGYMWIVCKLLSVLYSDFLSKLYWCIEYWWFCLYYSIQGYPAATTICREFQRDSLPHKFYLFVIPRFLVNYSLKFTNQKQRSISFYQSNSIYKSRKTLSW